MIGRIFLVIFLILQPFLGNLIINKFGGNLNKKNRGWYDKLIQSPLTPPSIVFPIVWSILYLLLGLSAVFYLYGKDLLKNLTKYIIPYELQMFLNFSWSVVFFGLQKPKISLYIIFAMIILTAYLLWISWNNKSKIAFWTLLPYGIWILFAMYLNFYIVIKNKKIL